MELCVPHTQNKAAPFSYANWIRSQWFDRLGNSSHIRKAMQQSPPWLELNQATRTKGFSSVGVLPKTLTETDGCNISFLIAQHCVLYSIVYLMVIQ